MENKFSERSKKNLSECHPDLQKVFLRVLEIQDCTIMEGHRPKEEQNRMVQKGLSKVEWPNSKHNSMPSEAIDVSPYPIDWKDTKRFYYFAGLVLGIAHEMGIELRWGGNWDMDEDLNDQNFMDLVHFERVVKDDNA